MSKGGGGDASPAVGIHTRRGTATTTTAVVLKPEEPMATGSASEETGARPTRQWAAWTREEEESFFGALRQVGKNFEKITSRVRSKNKDQVRHYYYRVIKRINRVLAPTLILDAKNSTYVNTAMLRWWTLLEKQGCSASKLRLKPRRLKTFVTALEHQLVKDHKNFKKSSAKVATASRRNAAHAERGSVAPPASVAESVSSGSGDSNTPPEDLQGRKNAGASRGTAVKRKAANNGPQKSGHRAEPNHTSRPSKRSTDGALSKAAHAKWEKAASVAVSLIAEAADQLERTCMAEATLPAPKPPPKSSEDDTGSTRNDHTDVNVQTCQIPTGTSEATAVTALKSTDNEAKETPFGPPLAQAEGLDLAVSSGLPETIRSPHQGSPSDGMLSSPLSGITTVPDSGNGAHEHVVIPTPSSVPVQAELGQDAPRIPSNNLETSTTNMAVVPDAQRNPPGNFQVSITSMAVTKLKLRLFPLDGNIRKALEQDGLNPHLELTCKARKSMSSVLDHLIRKWGRSSVASGDLRLFPFSAEWSTVSACQNWGSEDMSITAADVHTSLGNPTVFRLKYAWLSKRVLESSSTVLESGVHVSGPVLEPIQRGSAPPALESERLPESKAMYTREGPTLSPGVPREEVAHPNTVSFSHANSSNLSRADRREPGSDSQYGAQDNGCAWLAESNDGFARQLWNKDDALSNSSNHLPISQMDWLDNRAAVSVNELLPVPIDFTHSGQSQWSYPEAFDITLARPESPSTGQPLPAIWAGEDTCDAFSFQRSDRYNKETVDPWSKETSTCQLGDDVGLADFRSITCWREGEALTAFDVGEQCQDEDLLFDGDASTGLGGLIDALALGSLDDLPETSIDAYDNGVDGHSSEPGFQARDDTQTKGQSCRED